MNKWLRALFPPPQEDTLALLKRRAVEAGLDPSWFDELVSQPCCPGSLGPDDPGRIAGCKPECSGTDR